MTDIVGKNKRSQMMSGIRGKDTRPELIVRRELHRLGFRYRLHSSLLPGKPDIVFPRYKAVILINGCFWHQHDCHLFRWPATRKEFWRKKITGNKARDQRNMKAYQRLGWKALVIWECALKGKRRRPIEEVIRTVTNWLQYDQSMAEISGK